MFEPDEVGRVEEGRGEKMGGGERVMDGRMGCAVSIELSLECGGWRSIWGGSESWRNGGGEMESGECGGGG